MTFKFDGVKLSDMKLAELKKRVFELKNKTITPKLVSILAGDQKGALFYQRLKQEKAKEVGIELVIKKLLVDASMNRFIEVIERLNEDESVHGIMIQLPLPSKFSRKDRVKIIKVINRAKDVDGMREDSKFTSPVVKAVVRIYKTAIDKLEIKDGKLSILVVGYTGFEGRKIFQAFKNMDYEVVGADKDTKDLKLKTKKVDVIISATGVANLIKPEMVKEGVILIDVGSPKGDIDKSTYEKASFVSPVPGGVGPLTIAYLMENVYEASRNSLDC